MAFTKGELACFEKADDPAFSPPTAPLRFKVYRGLRGATNWAELHDRLRLSKKRLAVVVANIPCQQSQVNFGNFNWARENILLICRNRWKEDRQDILNSAFYIDRGVEWYEVLTLDQETLDWIANDDHWRYAFENN